MRYWLCVAAAFVFAVVVSWTNPATAIDNATYDWMCRLFPVSRPAPQALIVAVDETTLKRRGGMRALRSTLAELLKKVAAAKPAVVAVDFTLADRGDPAEDAQLAAAMAKTEGLILGTDLADDGSGWQDPLPQFAAGAKALGHVHADPDPVSRWIQLDKAAGQVRRWALALEALAPGTVPLETNESLNWAGRHIPSHQIRIAYSASLPTVSADTVLESAPQSWEGRVVFVGTTPLTAAKDRLMTPLGVMMPGVEINAQLFETLREGRFKQDLPLSLVFGLCAVITIAAAWAVRWRYAAGAAVILTAHALPFLAFPKDIVLPAFGLAACAWLPALTGGVYRYLATRKQLDHAEAEKSRYQKAIHWVTHEMRTPLTAIQGSSELMTRYNLPAGKQREIADMINSESKRLAQMISTFLSVERLSAGQVPLKKERLQPGNLIAAVSERARPFLDRKQQQLVLEATPEVEIEADRELLEFALYNLVTNASKYSPEGATVYVGAGSVGGNLHVQVTDQGIGIEPKDLAKVGTRFFRTRRAEESGIEGTGIGLSIVQEIVRAHGGRLEVTSQVGQGSCFTIVVPASMSTEVKSAL